DEQLRRWKSAAEITHAHVLHVFESGRCELGDAAYLYVVMERAEEDLAQILPERALSPEEVRAMLPSILDALKCIHSRGCAHGRIRPSNIQASGDQVKLSGDSVRAAGALVASPGGIMDGYDAPEIVTGKLTSASDLWSLAITLVEVLT